MPRHVKKGDRVMVTAGNERGMTGTIVKVMPADNCVYVDIDAATTQKEERPKDFGLRRKHVRPSQANPQGGRITIHKPIHISNVSPLNSANKPTRVRFVTREDGTKVRVAVKGGDELHTLHKPKSTRKS